MKSIIGKIFCLNRDPTTDNWFKQKRIQRDKDSSEINYADFVNFYHKFKKKHFPDEMKFCINLVDGVQTTATSQKSCHGSQN